MDWCVDARRLDAIAALLGEVGAYLRRHGGADGHFAAADLVLTKLMANVARHATGAVWECPVTVWLGGAPPGGATGAHEYHAQAVVA